MRSQAGSHAGASFASRESSRYCGAAAKARAINPMPVAAVLHSPPKERGPWLRCRSSIKPWGSWLSRK